MEESSSAQNVEAASLLKDFASSNEAQSTITTGRVSGVVTNPKILHVLFTVTAIIGVIIQLGVHIFLSASANDILSSLNLSLPSIFITAVRVIIGLVGLTQMHNSYLNKNIFTTSVLLSVMNLIQVGLLGGALSVLLFLVSPNLYTFASAFDRVWIFFSEILLFASGLALCILHAREDSKNYQSEAENTNFEVKKDFALGLIIMITQVLVIIAGIFTIIGLLIWTAFGGSYIALNALSTSMPVLFVFELGPIFIIFTGIAQIKTRSKIAASVIVGISLHSLLTFGYLFVVMVILFCLGIPGASVGPGSTAQLIFSSIAACLLLCFKLIPDVVTLIASLSIAASQNKVVRM